MYAYYPYSWTDAKRPCAAECAAAVSSLGFDVTTPSFEQRFTACRKATGALAVVAVGNPQWRATVALMDDGQLTMLCAAEHGGDFGEDFVRSVAMMAASFGMTSGGDKWAVLRWWSGCPVVKQTIPFCVGRDEICVLDGVTGDVVVRLNTRGRGGAYRTTSEHPALTAVERLVADCGPASHPQLPLLREVVANAARGAMRLVGARVKWQNADAGAATPTMSVQELSADEALAVTSPVISLRVNPVRQPVC